MCAIGFNKVIRNFNSINSGTSYDSWITDDVFFLYYKYKKVYSISFENDELHGGMRAAIRVVKRAARIAKTGAKNVAYKVGILKKTCVFQHIAAPDSYREVYGMKWVGRAIGDCGNKEYDVYIYFEKNDYATCLVLMQKWKCLIKVAVTQ